MRELVISDTSCLILLQKMGETDLLKKCFSLVLTTPEVAIEYGQPLPEWIEIRSTRNQNLQAILEEKLGGGESSAIALATERPDCTLILDDQKARKVAIGLNLDLTGSLGLFLFAKKCGVISAVSPLLEKLRQTDFRISDRFVELVLREAGE